MSGDEVTLSEGYSDVLMSFSDGGNVFDWPAIKAYAAQSYRAPKPGEPGADNMLSLEWQTYQHKFQMITMCRLALAARHEGWIASRPGEENPYPPEPMHNPEDGK